MYKVGLSNGSVENLKKVALDAPSAKPRFIILLVLTLTLSYESLSVTRLKA